MQYKYGQPCNIRMGKLPSWASAQLGSFHELMQLPLSKTRQVFFWLGGHIDGNLGLKWSCLLCLSAAPEQHCSLFYGSIGYIWQAIPIIYAN